MNYRYLIMDSSGEAAREEEWACGSDAEAIERASRSVSSYGAELWQGGRRVSAFAGPLSAGRRGEGRAGAPA